MPKNNPAPQKKKFLVALPSFRGSKGFNHRTILVESTDEVDARALVNHLIQPRYIGEIKEVHQGVRETPYKEVIADVKKFMGVTYNPVNDLDLKGPQCQT